MEMLSQSHLLKQFQKLVNRKSSLPYDGSQSPPVDLFVIENNYLGKGIISPQDNMAALAPLDENPTFSRAVMDSFQEIRGNLLILQPRELRSALQEREDSHP